MASESNISELDNSASEAAAANEKLGLDLYHAGDYCATALVLERAANFHRQNGNSVSADTAKCLAMTGRCYLYTGRPVEAELALYEALTILEHVAIEDQECRGAILIDLAILNTRLKNFSEAESLLHEAARQNLRHFGYGSSQFGHVFVHLSVTYALEGKLSIAEKTMEKAFRAIQFAKGMKDVSFAVALQTRGELYEQMGRVDAARESYREAIDLLHRLGKPKHFLLDDLTCRVKRLALN